MRSLCIHTEDKHELIEILRTYEIKEISMIPSCMESFTLKKREICRLYNCKITYISTNYLQDYDNVFPWFELGGIVNLKGIYFEYGTLISTQKLKELKINKFCIFSCKLVYGELKNVIEYLLKGRLITRTIHPHTYSVESTFIGYIKNPRDLDYIKV